MLTSIRQITPTAILAPIITLIIPVMVRADIMMMNPAGGSFGRGSKDGKGKFETDDRA